MHIQAICLPEYVMQGPPGQEQVSCTARESHSDHTATLVKHMLDRVLFLVCTTQDQQRLPLTKTNPLEVLMPLGLGC